MHQDSDLTQIAYVRGELLALNLNAAIREATDGQHSLDEVMRRLVEKRADDEEFRFSDETFAETVRQLAPEVEVRSVIETHVDRGEPVEPAADALGPCANKAGPGEFEPVDGIDEDQTCKEWLTPQ